MDVDLLATIIALAVPVWTIGLVAFAIRSAAAAHAASLKQSVDSFADQLALLGEQRRAGLDS